MHEKLSLYKFTGCKFSVKNFNMMVIVNPIYEVVFKRLMEANILHYSGTDKVERKKLEVEQEAWRTIDAMTENLREKVIKQSE